MIPLLRLLPPVLLMAGLASGCGRGGTEPPAANGDPWAALRDAYTDAASPAERADLAERFLADHPDHERAASALAMAVYPLKDELRDLPRARALAEGVLAHATDPEERFEVRMMLWEVSLEEGAPGDLREVAGELTPTRALAYGELWELVDAAARAEQWALVEEWSRSALDLATPDAWRAENPDSKLTEEQVSARATGRRAFALAHLAWAAFNLGRTEEAEATFAEAEAITPRNFVGVAQTPVDRFRGRAALRQGDLDRAESLLATDAVMGGDTKALADLRQIWAGRNGSEEGFEAYLWSTRQRLARPVADFVLSDYEGAAFDLASTRGKVVMLAFWFPT